MTILSLHLLKILYRSFLDSISNPEVGSSSSIMGLLLSNTLKFFIFLFCPFDYMVSNYNKIHYFSIYISCLFYLGIKLSYFSYPIVYRKVFFDKLTIFNTF